MGAVFPALPSASYRPCRKEVLSYNFASGNYNATHVSLPIALRAAFAMLISSCTGSDEIVFGEMAHKPGEDSIIVGELKIIEMQIDWTKTVFDFLQIAKNVRGAKAALDMARAGPGFQTLLKIGQIRSSDRCSSRNNNSYIPDDLCALIFGCIDDSTGLHIQAEYDPAVISGNMVGRILRQLQHLLQELCVPGSAETALAAIERLSSQDKHDISSWNATLFEASTTCVHELIGASVARHPDATAICAWDGELTYSQLDNMSTQLARRLIDSGIKADVIVVLLFEKSMWTIVAILAVMKAGGASVMLDPAHPGQRLRDIVDQANPMLVLASREQRELVVRIASRSVQTVDMEHMLALKPRSTQLPVVHPSSMLYVVFTSGSTGTPKGVIITHSNFSSAIRHQKEAIRLSRTSRVYDHVSYAFDIAWANMLHTLASGACLCIPSDSDRFSAIPESMKALGVNYAALTPTIARCLDLEILNELDTLVLTGEKVTLLDCSKRRGNTLNAYGPAECSVWSTIQYVQDQISNDPAIGKGFGLNTWIVQAETGELVPVGHPGELWLEGPLVGRGYLKDPVKTAAAFIEDPMWLLRGTGRRGRLYRTGDMVRYNEDGSLVYLGRKDAQVKIRGTRVELGWVVWSPC